MDLRKGMRCSVHTYPRVGTPMTSPWKHQGGDEELRESGAQGGLQICISEVSSVRAGRRRKGPGEGPAAPDRQRTGRGKPAPEPGEKRQV